MAPAIEVARAPRIPKLTYRNPLPADQTSIASQTTSTDASDTDLAADHHPSTFSALDSDSRSTTSSAATSLASNGSTSCESKASSKKKKSGVLNFLSLKEPSQLAFEQFAESQRKQQAAKGGSSSPIGFQGVSPQKLPTTVPKVNSKWDGIPNSVKSSRSSMASSQRSSTSSRGSQPTLNTSYNFSSSLASVITADSRGPPNSLASPMLSRTNVSDDTASGATTPTLDPSVNATLPEMSFFFPEELESADPPPKPEADHPWSPPPNPSSVSTDISPSLEKDFQEMLALAEEEAESRASAVDYEADAIFRKLKGGPTDFQRTLSGIEEEDPDPVPETHDFLFVKQPSPVDSPIEEMPTYLPRNPQPSMESSNLPPARPSPNFSRPRAPPHPYHKAVPPGLPTLYEVSIASTDDTATETGSIARTSLESVSSMAPSIATSYAPSEMSASWYRSPRERLGLGGRVRKNDVLPWERDEAGQRGKDKGKKSRLSMFSRS